MYDTFVMREVRPSFPARCLISTEPGTRRSLAVLARWYCACSPRGFLSAIQVLQRSDITRRGIRCSLARLVGRRVVLFKDRKRHPLVRLERPSPVLRAPSIDRKNSVNAPRRSRRRVSRARGDLFVYSVQLLRPSPLGLAHLSPSPAAFLYPAQEPSPHDCHYTNAVSPPRYPLTLDRLRCLLAPRARDSSH